MPWHDKRAKQTREMYRQFRSWTGDLIVAPQLAGKLEGRVRDGVAVLPSNILWGSEIPAGKFTTNESDGQV
jgi:hypothetical protein